MTEKKQPTKEKVEDADAKPKTCFVIMPISDMEGYEDGHFKRVYDHIIKPACKNSGFKPIRADEINTTNHIIIDILKQIVEADMAICDLSGRNPNVLYELGIRQAFNLPVTLLKDEKTSRVFDIQTLRDVSYHSSLRIDKIEEAIPEIKGALVSTYEDKANNINSIVQLLGIEAAKVTKTEVSEDTTLVLNAINDISRRLFKLEDRTSSSMSLGDYVERKRAYNNTQIRQTEFFNKVTFSLAALKDKFTPDDIIKLINQIYKVPLKVSVRSDFKIIVDFELAIMEDTITAGLLVLNDLANTEINHFELTSTDGLKKSVEIW